MFPVALLSSTTQNIDPIISQWCMLGQGDTFTAEQLFAAEQGHVVRTVVFVHQLWCSMLDIGAFCWHMLHAATSHQLLVYIILPWQTLCHKTYISLNS